MRVHFTVMSVLLTLCLSFFSTFSSSAKDGFNISVTIENPNDTLVYLCNYFGTGKSMYRIDSFKLNKTGTSKFTMKSDKQITGGIYILLFADRTQQFEFLLANGDEFAFSFDRANASKSAKFVGSKENTLFYEYQNFLASKGDEYTQVTNKLAEAKTKADTIKANAAIEKFNESVSAYRKGFVAKYKGTFVAKVVNALIDVDIPKEEPKLADGKTPDSTFKYRYYKQHYWDNYDLKDDRLVYTPILDSKLEMYFKRLVIQTPDSFSKDVDRLLAIAPEKSETYKYILWYTAREAEQSKIMGMDQAFVYIAEKYYLQGKAYWLHDSDIQKYRESVIKMSKNTIGLPGQEIMVPDINDKPFSLRNTVGKKDYTVLVFYDPTCGHCQKEVPKVDSVIRAMIKKGYSMQAVGLQNAQEDEKWRNFVKEKNLTDFWYHIYDPQHTSRYRVDYNVYMNPVFYLLDKNGIIIGKRFDHSNLEDFIQFYEKNIKGKNKQ